MINLNIILPSFLFLALHQNHKHHHHLDHIQFIILISIRWCWWWNWKLTFGGFVVDNHEELLIHIFRTLSQGFNIELHHHSIKNPFFNVTITFHSTHLLHPPLLHIIRVHFLANKLASKQATEFL